MKNTTEIALLRACRRGDTAAWNELFARHYAAAAHFVFQLGYDLKPEDVEEICQEAFLSVVRNLGRFKGNSQFQTWVFRIAANKARDYRQRQQAAKRGGGQSWYSLQDTDRVIDPPSPGPGPDSNLMQAEKVALLGQALERLDDQGRQIVELRYFADLSYEEIGRSMCLNPKTVSSRLSRCLDQLEAMLQI